jgi:hypothetical protein
LQRQVSDTPKNRDVAEDRKKEEEKRTQAREKAAAKRLADQRREKEQVEALQIQQGKMARREEEQAKNTGLTKAQEVQHAKDLHEQRALQAKKARGAQALEEAMRDRKEREAAAALKDLKMKADHREGEGHLFPYKFKNLASHLPRKQPHTPVTLSIVPSPSPSPSPSVRSARSAVLSTWCAI